MKRSELSAAKVARSVLMGRDRSNAISLPTTLGQQATQKALEQGIQQGMQQDKQETALRMLEKKLDIQLIAEVTKLSQKEIRLLLKKKNH